MSKRLAMTRAHLLFGGGSLDSSDLLVIATAPGNTDLGSAGGGSTASGAGSCLRGAARRRPGGGRRVGGRRFGGRGPVRGRRPLCGRNFSGARFRGRQPGGGRSSLDGAVGAAGAVAAAILATLRERALRLGFSGTLGKPLMRRKAVQVRVLASTDVTETVHGRREGGDKEGNASNSQKVEQFE